MFDFSNQSRKVKSDFLAIKEFNLEDSLEVVAIKLDYWDGRISSEDLDHFCHWLRDNDYEWQHDIAVLGELTIYIYDSEKGKEVISMLEHLGYSYEKVTKKN